MVTVPLQRINSEAGQIRFGRTMLTMLAAVLFAIGWTAAKLFGALWLIVSWTLTAMKVGWVEARKSSGG
jgi:hypothetical protein